MISTGSHSRNIYPNPIDNLKTYQAIAEEICHEADKASDCDAHGFLGISRLICWTAPPITPQAGWGLYMVSPAGNFLDFEQF